ncbi:MAG: DNA polymerase I, partial [Bacteroidota bacterium]
EEKIKQTIHDVKHNYFLVQTAEERKALIQKLSEVKEFCFDTETTGLDPHHCEIVGISFSIKPQEAYYIPLPDNYDEACTILSEFKSLFANENISKIGQNLKFDISVLRWYDVSVKGFLFDTMLAHYLIEPESRHNMDFLSNTYLNYSPVPITKLIGEKGKNQQSMRMVDLEEVKEYTCEDADVTLQLKQVFEPILKDNNADILFNTVETPLVPVLSAMEAEGVRIDPIVLNEFSAQMQIELVQLEQEIHSLAGKTFNVASPKQLGEVLFDHLKIDSKAKKTKTQQYSTGEEILAKLLNKHPIIQKILDFRSLTKLRSTYIDPLPLLINPRTGRVHTSFNQAVTSTGRLSSNNPNLQNIPIRTERGREIRKAFVPRNDKYVLMSADYSQIELRIIASMSGDEAMIADFKAGLDIHTATAAKVYHVALTDVTRDMRRNAKMVNFGIIYGISSFGLAERLGIARSESKNIIEEYFKQYPAIKLFMDSTIIKAREDGFVETILGRRRYLRDIHSANSIVRNFAERNAINAPIQGSAADMIKVAMIRIFDALEKKKLRSRLILQVHDELILDVLREETEEVDQIVREGMINAIPLDVPVEVELSTGANWLEAH